MKIKMTFLGTQYSKNKLEITKLRKQIGCVSWSGVGWTGGGLSINADFIKAGHGAKFDTLTLNGPEDIVSMFTEHSAKWAVQMEAKEDKPIVKNVQGAVDNFLMYSDGLSEKFKLGWVELIRSNLYIE